MLNSKMFRDCFLNITNMLNILLTKFKYNIVTYNLNEYKAYANVNIKLILIYS